MVPLPLLATMLDPVSDTFVSSERSLTNEPDTFAVREKVPIHTHTQYVSNKSFSEKWLSHTGTQ